MAHPAFPESNYGLDNPYEDPTMDWYIRGRGTTDEQGNLLEETSVVLKRLEEAGKLWPDVVRDNARLLARAGLWPGQDFIVIPYIGRPRTIEQNAGNAQRHGARGVEKFNMAKSFAAFATFETLDPESEETVTTDEIVILTGPGDLSFKASGITLGQVGNLVPLNDDQLAELGFEPGTVNPIGVVKRDRTIRYMFDEDLVSRATRDVDRKIYINAGDLGWSIALDIRKLIIASTGLLPYRGATQDICERGPEQDRVFARRDITLISGDSAQVGGRYYELLEALVRTKLSEANAYFGDDSMPDLDLKSRRVMGGTGSIALHGAEVNRHLEAEIDQIPKSRKPRLIAFTSNAGNLNEVVQATRAAIVDRPDLQLITVRDALDNYIRSVSPPSVVVFGLPEVVSEYPDNIGDTFIVRGKGKIEEWMQAARSASFDRIQEIGDELKKLIERTVKLDMANQKRLDGKDKGMFMQDASVNSEGVVILAGTELWDVLKRLDWQNGIPGLEKVQLVDPIDLLMQHLAETSLKPQNKVVSDEETEDTKEVEYEPA